MDNQADFASMPARALQVITAPDRFFRDMPKRGGFVDPLVFLVIVGIIDGILTWVAAIFHPAASGAAASAAGTLIVMPIVLVIMGFVFAAILFVLWRVMGSQENYETSFRTFAYAASISPISTLLGFFPYLGLIGVLWWFYLLVIASVEAHKIVPRVAWTVFAVLMVLFILASLAMQRAAMRMQGDLDQYQRQLDDMRRDMERQAPR